MMTFDEWWEEYSNSGDYWLNYSGIQHTKVAWDAATEAAKPRWIPLHEQLPTEIKPYAIKILDRDCPVIKNWSGNGWYNIGYETVTHWMELPE